jgi:hypothetical protein
LRRENADASEGIQREKVLIAGHDVGGGSAGGEGEEFVVFRVAADGGFRRGLDTTRFSDEEVKKPLDVSALDIPTNAPATDNIVKFGENGKREKCLAISYNSVKGFSRRRCG